MLPFISCLCLIPLKDSEKVPKGSVLQSAGTRAQCAVPKGIVHHYDTSHFNMPPKDISY